MKREKQLKYAEWINKMPETVNRLMVNGNKEMASAQLKAMKHIEKACEVNRIAGGLNEELRQMLLEADEK